MVDAALEYVRNALSDGHSSDEIRARLLEAGYQPADIDRLLLEAQPPTPLPSNLIHELPKQAEPASLAPSTQSPSPQPLPDSFMHELPHEVSPPHRSPLVPILFIVGALALAGFAAGVYLYWPSIFGTAEVAPPDAMPQNQPEIVDPSVEAAADDRQVCTSAACMAAAASNCSLATYDSDIESDSGGVLTRIRQRVEITGAAAACSVKFDTIQHSVRFSEAYKDSLRAQNRTEEEITTIEMAANTNAVTAVIEDGNCQLTNDRAAALFQQWGNLLPEQFLATDNCTGPLFS